MNRHRLTFAIAVAVAVAAAWAPPSSATAQQFLTGIDVSHYQGNINWQSVATAGVKFAFMKATQGYNYVDDTFARNIQQATANGILVGPYHFTDFDLDPTNVQDPIKQANHFLAVIKPYYDAGMYLPPVADVEGFDTLQSMGLLNRTFISNWTKSFSDTINSSLGVRPIIYASQSTANSYYNSTIASQHMLWEAAWKSSGLANPPTAADTPLWGKWDIWQWTDSFPVDGITSENPDGDVYAGTLDQLKALRVGTPPGPVTAISNFEIDEGYFNWATTYSGSNQNILATSTADRVTSAAHWGVGSEKVVVDTSAASWVLRFVSGIGSPAANPSTNLHLPATGSVGYWLKTTDTGVTTQILIDDKADNSSIEGGTIQNVIADGQWHLYEWNLQDAAQWNNYAGGDGTITEPLVTIDAIRFAGTHDSTIYLDDVTQNPAGSLAPPPGDFNGDYVVNAADLAVWQSGFASGGFTGADFLAWQRGLAVTTGATAAVPEPGALAMVAACLSVLGAATSVGRPR